MLSEEITRMAETEVKSCEIERKKPGEIKGVSSDEPLINEDDEQINSIGMHKKIYRNIKYDFFMPSLRRMTLFQSEGHWKERNCLMQNDHAWSLVLPSPKCEFDDALFSGNFQSQLRKLRDCVKW